MKNNTNIVTTLAQLRKNQTYSLPSKYITDDYLLLFVIDTAVNTTIVRHTWGPVIGSGYAGGDNMELTSGSYYSTNYYQAVVVKLSASNVVSIGNVLINGVERSDTSILYIVSIKIR